MLKKRYIIKQFFSYCTKQPYWGPTFVHDYSVKLRHDFLNGILVLTEERDAFETEMDRLLHSHVCSGP